MKTTLKHGSVIETVTPSEAAAIIDGAMRLQDKPQRIRASESGVYVAGGMTQLVIDVYKVPVGFEFEVRSVFIVNGRQLVDPQANLASLNGTPSWVEYRRSGQLITYGVPVGPNGANAVLPGRETWGAQQGPYLLNGEVFQVAINLGILGAQFEWTVTIEGILSRGHANR